MNSSIYQHLCAVSCILCTSHLLVSHLYPVVHLAFAFTQSSELFTVHFTKLLHSAPLRCAQTIFYKKLRRQSLEFRENGRNAQLSVES